MHRKVWLMQVVGSPGHAMRPTAASQFALDRHGALRNQVVVRPCRSRFLTALQHIVEHSWRDK